MEKEDLSNYLNFILNILTGVNCDDYYRENKESIDKVIKIINERHKSMIPENQKIYRGILLDPNYGEILKPINHIEYLSFSTNKEVAEVFADINHEMAMFYRLHNKDHKGFLIESNVNDEEIIFHYEWASLFGINKIFSEKNMEIFLYQKEVIVKNRRVDYQLVKYAK